MPASLEIVDYPIMGYCAAVQKQAIMRGEMSADSSDWLVNPLERSMIPRRGSAVVGDSIGSLTGLLETKIGARCRETFEWRSPLLSYPTYGAIFSNETDKTGTVYARSTTGPANYQLGEEFGSTHYPTSVGSVPRFKFIPLWCEAAQLHTRCTSSTQRKYLTPGTRRHVETQTWSLFPNAQGTPLMWNKQYNEATGSGSNVLRARPWGHYPPMFPPTKGTETAASGTDANLKDGDTFFLTVFFEDETGAISPAFQVREINGTLTSGLGLYTIGTVGGTAKYRSVQFDDIALGPEGTVARWLAASPTQNRASTSDPLTLSTRLEDFGAIARMANNVQTSYVYYGQSPSAFDPLRFRDDIVWAPRAQYAFAAEKRIILCGALKLNPAAIIVAPLDLSAPAGLSQNCADAAAAISNYFLVRVTSGSIKLKYDDGATTSETSISTSSSITLQDVVDAINATTTGGSAKRWCAQLAPGVDPTITSDNLALTTSSDFGDDGIVHDATTGNARAFGPTFPGLPLYFSQAYLSALPTDNEGIWMTSAQPGAQQSAYNDFRLSTRRKPSHSLGRCLGGAPIVGSNTGVIAVIYYERGRCALRNVKGGSSGADEDYQLVEIGSSRGCVSWSSIGAGNGWTHAMTEDGLEITDGDAAVIVSSRVWNREANAGDGAGPWSYEIAKSAAASASGGDDTYFYVSAFGSRLRVNYRASSASSTQANRGLVYDYSSEGTARGIREVVRGDGSPFPWSAPLTQKLGAMCMVVGSAGHKFYAGFEAADSTFSTGSGRIDQFDTGTDDNGTAIAAAAYFVVDHLDALDYKTTDYLDIIVHNADNGITLTMYRDENRTVSSTFAPDPVNTVADRSRLWMPFDGSRDRYRWCEILIAADVLSSDFPKVYGLSNAHRKLIPA